MHEPPLLLVVDDNADNRAILVARLESQGFATAEAEDGPEALEAVLRLRPDLLLLDVMMPGMDGLEVTRRLKADPALPFTPILLVTARTAVQDVVRGLEAGADDYLTKPIEQQALVARVRSMLRIKALHDQVQGQALRLEAQAAELAALNAGLEARVEAQLRELERARQLRRFLSPELADLLMREGGEGLLDWHRREVTVVFADLRGFTAFAETSAPEDVMAVLDAYHAAMGEVIFEHQGTLERFLGDGVVVVFNDPLPCPDHPARAVAMAVAARTRLAELSALWRRRGHAIGFGLGLAQGFATLGRIGFEGRRDYAVIGPVPNLAARLCDAAADGEILLSQRLLASLEGRIRTTPPVTLALKGLSRPIVAAAVVGMEGCD